MGDINIVIVGAGVTGLTTALLLSENPRYKITVAAKHMPGDYDIQYASPWAGANYMPVSLRDTPAAQWDRDTFPYLVDLARNHPESGIHFQKTKIFNRRKDVQSATAAWFADLLSTDPWWKDTVLDFKVMNPFTLPEGVDSATEFTSVCLNTAIYLPYLVSRLLATRRVVLKRSIFKHILDAAKIHHTGKKADIVINCTGLSARTLGGVMDENMIPARGQTILVRNESDWMGSISGSDDGEDEVTYLMTRAAGGGSILGGCYQKGNYDGSVDLNLASRIMKRVLAICPELADGKGPDGLDIVKHNVGLRPVRINGTRIEREAINDTDGTQLQLVHNYGHGGFGYQSSYGCSKVVVGLVNEAVEDLGKTTKQAKAKL